MPGSSAHRLSLGKDRDRAREKRPIGHIGLQPLGFSKKSFLNVANYLRREYAVTRVLFDPQLTWIVALLMLVLEILINGFIIDRVKYTEIDWSTYMQQVDCFLNGTLNYEKISGDTGPLVYPAGHLYVYTILYYMTNRGTNLKAAQYIFAGLYLLNLVAVFRVYWKTLKVPPYALMLMCCTSYRVHSIFILRMFNDPIAMTLLYVALNLFLDRKWTLGCFIYSLSVSVKMNTLFFAPALLLILLEMNGLRKTINNLILCAFTQLVLGLPFLSTDPLAYMHRAFDFGRVFLFKWTVNWRFVPEEVFVSRAFHLSLLASHLLVLLAFQWKRWYSLLEWLHAKKPSASTQTSSERIVLTLFTANFIGIAFSRSLHYQFYVWYFHSLPFLLWSTSYAQVTKLCIIGLIELCWNTYPSTPWSSLLLHAMHLLILSGLWRGSTSPQSSLVKKSID